MKQVRTTAEFERDVKRLRKRNKSLIITLDEDPLDVILGKITSSNLHNENFICDGSKGEDFESWEETIYLHSIPGLVSSILEADNEKLEDCTKHKDINWQKA